MCNEFILQLSPSEYTDDILESMKDRMTVLNTSPSLPTAVFICMYIYIYVNKPKLLVTSKHYQHLHFYEQDDRPAWTRIQEA